MGNTDNAPNIKKLPTLQNIAETALEIFKAKAVENIDKKGFFTVAISGGKTPEPFFKLLADDKDIDWSNIHIFWVDERYVPATDENSNCYLAKTTFLDKVAIPRENIHPIPTDFDDYDAAAGEYEATIRTVFNLKQDQIPEFDLMVLGMGSDGHIGSLLPDTYAVFETKKLTTVVYVMDNKLNRISLTYPVMRAAKQIVILIAGQEKAKTLQSILKSEPDKARYPIHCLWPVLDKVIWLIDAEAAKLI